MNIIIPEIESGQVFPAQVLEDLFAWADKHCICLYCDRPQRIVEEGSEDDEPFDGFADFLPYGVAGNFEITADTPIFGRDPHFAEHRYFVGEAE